MSSPKRNREIYRKVMKIADAEGKTFLATAHELMDEWMEKYGVPFFDSWESRQRAEQNRSRFQLIRGGGLKKRVPPKKKHSRCH